LPHLDRYRRVLRLDGTAFLAQRRPPLGQRRRPGRERRHPLPLRGIDSDNGGEFNNRQLIDWCAENSVRFNRGRPYRKNDNCFVEQKNGDRVRKTIGYHRFDTEAEQAALAEVYRFTNPLTNFWNPSVTIIAKQKLPNGRCKKIYDKPKTPVQRLLENKDVSGIVKKRLRKAQAQTNPLTLRRLEPAALARLDQIRQEKERLLRGENGGPRG
jgi:hypothetical protein